MRYCLTLVFILCLFHTDAQHWYASYLPHARGATDVIIRHPLDLQVVGGNYSNDSIESTFRSNSGGMDWIFLGDYPGSSWLKSFAFSSDQRGIAVGSNGKMKQTLDGGLNWINKSLPVAYDLNKIVFTDSLTGIIVGSRRADTMQVVLKSTDAGESWSVIYEQHGWWLNSIYFSDALHGFAVGDSATILKTSDGGYQWTPVTSPTQRNFTDVTFVDANTGYIIGGQDSIRTILRTTDGGLNWGILKDETGSLLTDICFLNNGKGYLVGDRATFMTSTDAGQNWTLETIPGNQGEKFTCVDFYDENFGFIGHTSGVGANYIFSGVPAPEVTTAPAFSESSSNTVLRGYVNTHGISGMYTFLYDTLPSFGTATQTYPPLSVSCLTATTISTTLYDLEYDKTYYYYIKVTTASGDVSSAPLQFHTGAPYKHFQTGGINFLNTDSVNLGGNVTGFTEPVNLFFEYGTTDTLGLEIAANPVTVNDTAPRQATGTIYQLQKDKIYYVRFKGVTATDTYYGQTTWFYTGTRCSQLQTLPVTNPTNTSATLNGSIEGATVDMGLFFSYGTDLSMMNYLDAMPKVVKDGGYHTFSIDLTQLQPDRDYFYRIRATPSTGPVVDGNTMFFHTGNPNSYLRTLPASSVYPGSAQLNGEVYGLSSTGSLDFELGTAPFLNNVPTGPAIALNDTLYHAVHLPVNQLVPNTTYYYRLRLNTPNGFFYGDTVSFETVDSTLLILTHPATEVDTLSATMNGEVYHLYAAADLSFEYGTSTAFGLTVPANIPGVTDTARYFVKVPLSGLSANTFYYYRLRVNIGGTILYGDTMVFYTGMPEIPNWDFQYWDMENVVLPAGWNLINRHFEKVPGHSGSALKIDPYNFAMLGFYDESLVGVQPFHSRPDSISFYADYNMETGDTATVLVYLFKSDSLISQNVYPLGGTTGGAFHKYVFPLSYSSSLTPDGLIMSMAPVNFNAPHFPPDPANYLSVDDISFSPAGEPVDNGNFETWFNCTAERPLSWYYRQFILVDSSAVDNSRVVARTIFDAPGDYAAEIRTLELNNILNGGSISNTDNLLREGGPGFPVTVKHQTLFGYYKFYPVNSDSAFISIKLYANGQPVGYGSITLGDSVTSFRPFEIPIEYSANTPTPDTATITIQTFTNNTRRGLSRMEVDKLCFDGFAHSTPFDWHTISPDGMFVVYPNPASSTITVLLKELKEGSTLNIYDLKGSRVFSNSFTNAAMTVNVGGLAEGMYVLKVNDNERKSGGRLMILR